MKHSPLLPLFICLLSFTNCKKKDNRNFSYWQVNQHKFSTNDITVEEGKARHEINTSNYTNGFQIVFNLGYFPMDGKLVLNDTSSNPSCVGIDIIYNDTGYLPKPSSSMFLIASAKNNKGSYALQPVWFYNSYRIMDSVLVQGVFNEP
jgi:hypothetical protein